MRSNLLLSVKLPSDGVDIRGYLGYRRRAATTKAAARSAPAGVCSAAGRLLLVRAVALPTAAELSKAR